MNNFVLGTEEWPESVRRQACGFNADSERDLKCGLSGFIFIL